MLQFDFFFYNYSQTRWSVPVANELINSLTEKWFRLLIQYSIHKMNNPIFRFSLDSIIECWFDYCFLKNYTLFFFFFLRVERGRVLKFKPKQTVTCTPFCFQYNTSTDVTSEVSVCAVIGGFRSPIFVSFFAFAVCLFYLLFWLKAIKNAIVSGSKREANTIELNRQE